MIDLMIGTISASTPIALGLVTGIASMILAAGISIGILSNRVNTNAGQILEMRAHLEAMEKSLNKIAIAVSRIQGQLEDRT